MWGLRVHAEDKKREKTDLPLSRCSSCPAGSCLCFSSFSKYLVLDKMCSLCKPGYITWFPVPTTTKVNFVLSAGQLEGEEFVSWFNNNNWTHGRCSFLRSIRCACSHTHTFPLHVLHKCPCADRECNSMGWLWSTQKKKKKHKRRRQEMSIKMTTKYYQ